MDTNGLVLKVIVTRASIGDRAGAKRLIKPIADAFPRMKLIWVDGGYDGTPLAQWVNELTGWPLKWSVDLKAPPDFNCSHAAGLSNAPLLG